MELSITELEKNALDICCKSNRCDLIQKVVECDDDVEDIVYTFLECPMVAFGYCTKHDTKERIWFKADKLGRPEDSYKVFFYDSFEDLYKKLSRVVRTQHLGALY